MNKISQIHQKCLYCGTSLIGMCQPHKRKYCSSSCGGKIRLRKRKPGVQAKLWQHEREVFENAMEMYWSGMGGAAIARHFNIPVGTVYSWVHDFGGRRERIEAKMPPAADRPSIKSPRERFGAAESADEWIEVLRGETQYADDPFADMTVRLVCGTLHGQSAGKLAAVISESLKEDPLSGRSYAFCSKGRNSVAVLTWKDPVYSIAKYVKTHGTFIWPHENLGRTIEITKAEFDRLLFLKKHEKVSGKVLQKTPESLISCGFHGIIRYEKCS